MQTISVIATKDINDKNNTFILDTHFDDSFLISSIKKNGLLNPLKIYKINNNNIILSGYRRYKCISKLKLDSIPCICYESKSLTIKDAFKISLIDNYHRNYSELEKALIINKLQNIFPPDDAFFKYAISEILHINYADLAFYKTLLLQDAHLLELLHTNKLKKYQIEWLLTLNKEEQNFFLNLLSKLYLTKNQFHELIKLLNDICRIWDIPSPLYIFYIPDIKKLINSIEQDKKNSSLLLQTLTKYAYPLTSLFNYKLNSIIQKLDLHNAKIIYPKYLEGNSFKIFFECNSYEDFKNKICSLSNLTCSPYINKLFDYAKKIFII